MKTDVTPRPTELTFQVMEAPDPTCLVRIRKNGVWQKMSVRGRKSITCHSVHIHDEEGSKTVMPKVVPVLFVAPRESEDVTEDECRRLLSVLNDDSVGGS